MAGDGEELYYGKHGTPQKYDPTFKGPINKRGCTDVICCITLLVAIVGYVAVGIVAWTHGDPRKVIYPTDSRGQFCGQKGTVNENKTFLFYFNIMKCASPLVLLEFQCPTTQICVQSCPSRYLTLIQAYNNPEELKYYSQFCQPGFNWHQSKKLVEVLRDGDCPAMLTPSKPLVRRCLPAIRAHKGVLLVGNETTFDDGRGQRRNVTDLVEGAKKANVVLEARQLAMRIFEDYTVSWYWILIGLVIAMVMSFIFIVLLRFLAGIMVWIMIVLVILVLAYGIFHCYMEYARLRGEAGADISLSDLGFQTDLRVYLHLRQTWMAFMIILCCVEFLIILLLIFLRKRILVAVALIKEASRAVGYVMCSLLYPLGTFFLLCLCIAYWASTAVFLSTSNEAIYKVFNDSACDLAGQTCDPKNFTTNTSQLCRDARCQFAFYGGETSYHRLLLGLQLYNAFMFFWLANFALALGQVTLAGAFASYYWALRKPDDLPAFPLFSAFGRALRYHTGSLAFGSLILAIVQLIRVILEYLDHRLKAAQNRFAKFLLTCLKCCFWCLEKFIKFLNRNAYIMIAIYGTNFCTSAKNAFFLLMRNIIRVAVLDKVTDFLLLLGKLLVVGSVGILAFFFFTHRIRIVQDTAPPLNYYWVPILTVIVGSYLIAHGFFSVYGMCVDTLFLCFLEDLERNDGSTEKPYFMSSNLKKLLKKSNKSV